MMDKHEKNKQLSRKIWDMAEHLRAEVDSNSLNEVIAQMLLLKLTPEPNDSNKSK